MFGAPVGERFKSLPVLAMLSELQTVTRIFCEPVEKFILFSGRQSSVVPQDPLRGRGGHGLRIMI
jgi:hypothetical protein